MNLNLDYLLRSVYTINTRLDAIEVTSSQVIYYVVVDVRNKVCLIFNFCHSVFVTSQSIGLHGGWMRQVPFYYIFTKLSLKMLLTHLISLHLT